ncbi:MAG: hypothetical protein KF861_07325 [Planctomycetaceae bacterium]|nr:hypothetical protein [Planctomycetaceae bacterium]
MVRLQFSIAWLLLLSALSTVARYSSAADESLPIPGGRTVVPQSVLPDTSGAAAPIRRTKRVLLVTWPECPRCSEELQRLQAAGGPFELMRNRGWLIGRGPENHIQIVDASNVLDADIAELVSELTFGGSPVVLYVEQGAIARSFQRGCTTPLDQWTFGWLMTGNDERPVDFDPEPIDVATTGHYRLRGNHWSVDGNWNPSREYVIQHLRAAHPSQLQPEWDIEVWSLEELRSVHDDIHDREEGFRGRYTASTATRSSSSSRSSSSGAVGYRKPGNAGR